MKKIMIIAMIGLFVTTGMGISLVMDVYAGSGYGMHGGNEGYGHHNDQHMYDAYPATGGMGERRFQPGRNGQWNGDYSSWEAASRFNEHMANTGMKDYTKGPMTDSGRHFVMEAVDDNDGSTSILMLDKITGEVRTMHMK